MKVFPTLISGAASGGGGGGGAPSGPAGGGLSGSYPNPSLAPIAANTVLGNATGSSATPTALSTTSLTTLVNAFTPTLSGAAPLSGGGTTNFLRADGAWAVPAGGGGGSGTVTSVSVTTANGVSGSVANATTTPAISLTLGAITPASVAASGAVSGSNLSGTNTGDQTITLTGDVTGSGSGSFATTAAKIGGNAVSLGGALTLSGAFGTTFTVTATTSITLPTSGTLLSSTTQIASSVAGAASIPIVNLTGALPTGTATTAFPGIYYNASGAVAVTSFSTNTTVFGVNAASGFAGNFFDMHVNGGGSLFSVSSSGNVTTSGNYTGASYVFSGNSTRITAPSNGAVLVQNNGQTAIATIQMGRPHLSKTANYQILFSDSNTVFDNTGASGEVDFTLPAGAVGQTFTFNVRAAQILKIIMASGMTGQVIGSATSSGGNISASTIGNSITIYVDSTTTCIATSVVQGTINQWATA